MSHDEDHMLSTSEKLVMMANQIATFFRSKPHEEGVADRAEHINKFWEPRMRRQFFEMIDAGGQGFQQLVLDAAPRIRRPKPESPPPGRAAAAAAAPPRA